MHIKTFKKVMSRVGIAYFLFLMFMYLTQSVFAGVVSLVFPQIVNENYYMWLVSYIPIYAVCLPLFCLIFGILLPIKEYKPKVQRVKLINAVLIAIVSFGATYFFNFVTVFIQEIITLLTGTSMENPIESMLEGSGILWASFFICIVAPIGEEIIFRKMLCNKIGPLGDKVFIITSGILFGLFHTNLAQLFYATALGMILAYIYCRTGKIIYPILLHMLINFVGTVVSYFSLENEILSIALTIFIYVNIVLGSGIFMYSIFNKKIVLNGARVQLPPKYMGAAFSNPGMLFYISFCIILGILTYIIM